MGHMEQLNHESNTMKWNANAYHDTCGRVTEHGVQLVQLLKEFHCGKVLDLGCGTGVLTNQIAGFASEVIGIDASPDMIDFARSSYPNIPFQVTDACRIPWTQYFDAVFSNAVFHFITSQDALLDSIHKALKPNGALVCEFGAAGNIAAILAAAEAACVTRGKPYTLRFYYPTREAYGHLLEKHGFTIDTLHTYDLDTRLREGAGRLRDWICQVFRVEMDWFNASERKAVLHEIETALRPALFDGTYWHIPNRRIRVVARSARRITN